MSLFTTRDNTLIYYKDWGSGQPVVFSHGWPLSSDAFEDQMLFLAGHGYRCIAHDRRGHGRSSAILFAKEGAKVAITGRRTSEGGAMVSEITAAGGKALFVTADLTQTETIVDVISQVVLHFGRLDCAFNNAGISAGSGLPRTSNHRRF